MTAKHPKELIDRLKNAYLTIEETKNTLITRFELEDQQPKDLRDSALVMALDQDITDLELLLEAFDALLPGDYWVDEPKAA